MEPDARERFSQPATRPLALSMEDARQTAVQAAYQQLSRSGRNPDGWKWICFAVELESLSVGVQAYLVYRVVLELSRHGGLFREGGRWRMEFKLDAASGALIGFEDQGFGPY